MNIQEFIEKRPELYHLTAQSNFPIIKKYKRLYSTNKIIDLSGDKELIKIKRERRPSHLLVKLGEDSFSLRDQRPISEKALKKCLTDNWECADFYEHLNDRVFTWPTLNRLYRHYDRYKGENPAILILNTEEVFNLNLQPLFARLNTGATRANSHLGGKAPERGPNTFLSAEDYDLNIASVAEVTFLNELILPTNFEICYEPEGKRKNISL
jgi:hypothetical protein